jgi:ABC-type uncharacterized transport system fused permease/ATPase subunit
MTVPRHFIPAFVTTSLLSTVSEGNNAMTLHASVVIAVVTVWVTLIILVLALVVDWWVKRPLTRTDEWCAWVDRDLEDRGR